MTNTKQGQKATPMYIGCADAPFTRLSLRSLYSPSSALPRFLIYIIVIFTNFFLISFVLIYSKFSLQIFIYCYVTEKGGGGGNSLFLVHFTKVTQFNKDSITEIISLPKRKNAFFVSRIIRRHKELVTSTTQATACRYTRSSSPATRPQKLRLQVWECKRESVRMRESSGGEKGACSVATRERISSAVRKLKETTCLRRAYKCNFSRSN